MRLDYMRLVTLISAALWPHGSMRFESDGESVRVLGVDTLEHLAELTSTETADVSRSLLYRAVATGGGEVILKGHSQTDACFGRDAFAKVGCPSSPDDLFTVKALM